MKKYYFRFRIMLMTFAFGLASVFMMNGSLQFSDEIAVDLPEVNSDSVFEISVSDDMLFSSTGHGCGLNKYGGRGSGTTFHSSFYGQRVISEIGCHDKMKDAKRELELRIKDADKVLAFEETSNSSKEARIILETNNGGKWIEILKFDGKKCFSIISAPSLEPALEFEKLTESQN